VPFNLTLAADTFIDPNGDVLKYSTSKLPTWLKFDSSIRKFTGVPTTYG